MITSMYGKEHSVRVGDRMYRVEDINGQMTLCGFEVVGVEPRKAKNGNRLLPVITLKGMNVTFGKDRRETTQERKLSLYYATPLEAIRAEYATLLAIYGANSYNHYEGDIEEIGRFAQHATELARIYHNWEDIVKSWEPINVDNCHGGDCERHQLGAEPCANCEYCDEKGNI